MFNPNATVTEELSVIETIENPVILNPFEQVKAHHGVSDRYKFISTQELKEAFSQKGYNFEEVNKVKARKASLKGFEKHSFAIYGGELLSKSQVLDKGYPRIIGTNSHNVTQSTSLILRVGFFRRVCSNGLLVSEDIFPAIRIRHVGLTVEKIMKAVETISEQYDVVDKYFQKLQSLSPTREQMIQYAKEMASQRLSSTSKEVVSIDNAEDLLTVRRIEDEPKSWWEVINTVQENLIGKPIQLSYKYKSLDSNQKEVIKERRTKKTLIRNIDAHTKLNQACFSVANEIIGLRLENKVLEVA